MPYYADDRLRARRKRAGFTQKELAEEAGVAENTVSNAETGWPVRKATLRKLARPLITDPLEIGFWSED